MRTSDEENVVGSDNQWWRRFEKEVNAISSLGEDEKNNFPRSSGRLEKDEVLGEQVVHWRRKQKINL